MVFLWCQGCVLPSATSSSTAPLTWDRHQRLWPSPSPGTEDKFTLYVQHEDHIKTPLICVHFNKQFWSRNLHETQTYPVSSHGFENELLIRTVSSSVCQTSEHSSIKHLTIYTCIRHRGGTLFLLHHDSQFKSSFKSQSTYTHLTISKHCRPQNVSGISALLSKRRNTPHNITWLHESYLI